MEEDCCLLILDGCVLPELSVSCVVKNWAQAREFLLVVRRECFVLNQCAAEDDDVIDDRLTILSATCILRLTLNRAARHRLS